MRGRIKICIWRIATDAAWPRCSVLFYKTLFWTQFGNFRPGQNLRWWWWWWRDVCLQRLAAWEAHTVASHTNYAIPAGHYDQYCPNYETVILSFLYGYHCHIIHVNKIRSNWHKRNRNHTHTHTHINSTVVLGGIILDTLHEEKTSANSRNMWDTFLKRFFSGRSFRHPRRASNLSQRIS